MTSEQKKQIETITFFVIDRCDAPSNLELKSLWLLSEKDLAWLAAAVENC